METTLLTTVLKGLTYSSYNSFNGDSIYFVIEDTAITESGCIELRGTNSWGNNVYGFESPESLIQLLTQEEIVEEFEIDHCYCKRTTRIYKNKK